MERCQAAVDHIAAAWALCESGFRTEDGSSVASNKARAVAHLRDAIRAIEGGRQ